MHFERSAPATLAEIATNGLAIGIGNLQPDDVSVQTNYNPDWTNLYNTKGWIAQDPAVSLGLTRTGIQEWSLAPHQGEFQKAAFDHGLSQGIVVSSNIGGSRCIAGMSLRANPNDSERRAALMATQRHHLQHLTERGRKLSQPQKDLVFLFSMGLRSKEVAAEFGISEDAVKQRKLTILKQLGANNFLVAVNIISRIDCEDHLLRSEI
jgi:DNA-binding CsgD family transcriptional regulator